VTRNCSIRRWRVRGNKCIELTVAAVFLEINGYSLNAPEEEVVIIYQKLADGRLTEETLAELMRELLVSGRVATGATVCYVVNFNRPPF